MSRVTMNMFGSPTRVPQQSAYTVASTDILDIGTMNWTTMIGYSAAVLVVLLILLLFINYTLYPIFQLQPGGSGFIRIPFMESQTKLWPPKSKPYTLDNITECSVNNDNRSINWSMILDISIMNPTLKIPATSPSDGSLFRLLFNRGGTPVTLSKTTKNDGTIRTVITGHNIAIGLLKDTNDLYVSFTTEGPSEQGVLLTNVPTQTPFRIGVVIMSNYVEVYLNGKLSQTKQLERPIASIQITKDTPFAFEGPTNSPNNQIARLGNLMIWNQVVSPTVIQYATPSLMPMVPGLDLLTLSATASCGTGSMGSALNDLFNSASARVNNVAAYAYNQMNTPDPT